jgi:hypothetical protein
MSGSILRDLNFLVEGIAKVTISWHEVLFLIQEKENIVVGLQEE